MVGWRHRLDGREFEQTLGDSEGQGSLACCSPWGCKESDTTERRNTNSAGEGWKVPVPWDQGRAAICISWRSPFRWLWKSHSERESQIWWPEQQRLTVSQFWRLEGETEVRAGFFLLRPVREASIPGLSLWPEDGHLLSLCVSMLSSLYICLSVSKLPLFIRTPVILD